MSRRAYEQIKQAGPLPSPTGVALEILRLAGSEKTTLDEFITVVESDPAIAGRLLKLVNSPFAGVSRRIASVPAAVRLLGMRTVKNLALGFSLLSNHRNGRCRAFAYDVFWSRSLARAVAARGIAQQLTGFHPDEAFTLGLLSEVGCLALATACAEQYERVLTLAGNDDPARLLAAERDAFGIDHHELSAEMMTDWHLQELFCSAVRQQGNQEAGEADPDTRAASLRRILSLARVMAEVLTNSDIEAQPLVALAGKAATLGLSGEQFRSLFDSTAREWGEAGLVFSVGTRDVPPLEELEAQARAVMEARATATAASPPTADAGGRPLRILAVDDDPDALRLLEHYLTGAGYSVVTAANGTEALSVDLAEAPQMVITDWLMPGLDGLELCRQLRAHAGLGFVYVIVMTAQSERERVVEALNAGADEYLTKPYGRDELLARVRAGQRIIRLQADLASRSQEILEFNARLSIANERLQTMSVTDELTGLANRREGLARLAECWSQALRYDDPLSCIIADLDWFKQLNDTHGHAAGDLALKETARRLLGAVRAGEVVCRMGGEEFLILCPRAPASVAERVAERLRLAMASAPVQLDGRTVSVTISLGVAERRPSVNSPEDLLKSADEALYAAKAAGRNRVCVAGQGGSAPGRPRTKAGGEPGRPVAAALAGSRPGGSDSISP